MADTNITAFNRDGEIVVDSRLIAVQLGIKHESFIRTVRKYRELIESRFGHLRFEIGTVTNTVGAKNETVYALLNEPQATVIMTLSRNTEQVVECKFNLVEAFEKAKTLLIEKELQTIETALPAASLEEIDKVAFILGKRHGAAYEESLLAQNIKKHYPQLTLPEIPAKERSSLKSAEALLTPTQIAKELGFKYKTGNPNPQAVNTMLATLGYQEKIDNKWSATEKGKPYSDRKPVSTNSRSDKDQLFWYRSILDVLKSDSETLEVA